MEWSHWEHKNWFGPADFTIIGAGIVGLSCALELRKKYPSASITILERGIVPQGASTKNAGFACTGSPSELLEDLKSHGEDRMLELVDMRLRGLEILKERLEDSALDYQSFGGYEVFAEGQELVYEECMDRLRDMNLLLKSIFGRHPFRVIPDPFGFKKTQPNLIALDFEGQLDPGKMMRELHRLAQTQNIFILNNILILGYQEDLQGVSLQTTIGDLHTKQLLIATNGFSKHLLNLEIKPARAQVVLTNPIHNLHIKGVFHMNQGFDYFRNIDGRILLGGGRNLNIEGETTDEFGQTTKIQDYLERLLREVILPNKEFTIEKRWSGIMGMGPEKHPIIKRISEKVVCGVRLGGMGVALGSLVGKRMAELC